MWTSIRTKRLRVSLRQRQLIDAFVRRTFQRELQYVDNLVITLSPAKLSDVSGHSCQVRIQSRYLGLIIASDVGDTLRTAVQQASLRARGALRRRLHKRHSRARRWGQSQHARRAFSDNESRLA
jgi:hypothetical protein